MRTVVEIVARLFAVPLPEVLTDAKHGEHTHLQLVTATVRLSDAAWAPDIRTPAAREVMPFWR